MPTRDLSRLRAAFARNTAQHVTGHGGKFPGGTIPIQRDTGGMAQARPGAVAHPVPRPSVGTGRPGRIVVRPKRCGGSVNTERLSMRISCPVAVGILTPLAPPLTAAYAEVGAHPHFNSPCKVENAQYQQRTAPSITARFQDVDSGSDWPEHIALPINIGASNRDYWWLPWNGGSNGEQNLASTTDVIAPGWNAPSPDDGRQRPLGDVSFLRMDADYNVLASVPYRGGKAPAHFFIHDLGEGLWYRTPSDKRDASARQFFAGRRYPSRRPVQTVEARRWTGFRGRPVMVPDATKVIRTDRI